MPENEYSLILTKQAETELNGILDYIVDVFRAGITAEHTLDAVIKGVERLKTMPYSAPLMDEYEYQSLGIRRLVIKNYSVFYMVSDKKRRIEILHILHGIQDYTQKL